MTKEEFQEAFRGPKEHVRIIFGNKNEMTVEESIRCYNRYIDQLWAERETLEKKIQMYKDAFEGQKAVVNCLQFELDKANQTLRDVEEYQNRYC